MAVTEEQTQNKTQRIYIMYGKLFSGVCQIYICDGSKCAKLDSGKSDYPLRSSSTLRCLGTVGEEGGDVVEVGDVVDGEDGLGCHPALHRDLLSGGGVSRWLAGGVPETLPQKHRRIRRSVCYKKKRGKSQSI